jgi:RNA polymerase sigma factor (sigma-70 family)
MRNNSDAELLDRFVRFQDEEAFEALLHRHGPVVLGVCRRVLGQAQDSEDAFQATFLVLARNAAAIRRPEALASWLLGVAYKVAARLRKASQRARALPKREVAHTSQRCGDPISQVIWQEMQPILDEELCALPEKYRAPLVMCTMQGRSQAEAARALGCPSRSLTSRLARGHELLRGRLARRGVTLSVGLLTGALNGAATAASAAHAGATVKAAVLLARGQAAVAGGVSASVEALAAAAGRAILWAKVRNATVALLFLGIVATTGWLRDRAGADGPLAPAGVLAAQPLPAPKERADTDRYGDSLPAGVRARMGTLRWRHEKLACFAAFAPDGSAVVSAGKDGTVRRWEVATGQEKWRIDGLGQWFDVACSPDGKEVVICDQGALSFRDARTGKELRDLNLRDERPFTALAFSPDSKQLALQDGRRVIRLHEAATGKELRRFGKPASEDESSTAPPAGVAFTAAGKLLVSVGVRPDDSPPRPDGTRYFVRIWDVATGKELRRIDVEPEGDHFSVKRSLVLTPDGKAIAWTHANGTATLHELSTGKVLCNYGSPRPLQDFCAAAISPDGRKLACKSLDGGLLVWDVGTGRLLHQLDEPLIGPVVLGTTTAYSDWLAGLAFSPDSKTLASASNGNLVRMWEVATGKQLPQAGGHIGTVTALAFRSRDKMLATQGQDRTVRLWDATSGVERRRFTVNAETSVNSGTCAFAAGGRLLAIAGADGVRIWDVAQTKEIHRLGRRIGASALAFSANGRVVAWRQEDAAIDLWDLHTGKALPRVMVPGEDAGFRNLACLALSPDGQLLAAPEETHGVVLWSTTTGKACRPIRGLKRRGLAPGWAQPLIQGLEFSPDGRTLAVVDADWVVALWEVATGSRRLVCGPLEPIRAGHNSCETCRAAFSPDGKTLAAGSPYGEVRLWSARTGKELARWRGHRGRIAAMAFSSDGRTLATGSADTTALLWDLSRYAVGGSGAR